MIGLLAAVSLLTVWNSHLSPPQLPGQIELPCPVGFTPLSYVGQTYDAPTAKYRQWACVDTNGNVNIQVTAGSTLGGTPPLTQAIQQYSVTTESSGTALTANVLTTVLTKAVTMPSAGCPCRVHVSYFQYMTTSGASAVAEALISDGSSNFAESEWSIPVNNGVSGGGSGWSPVTYANSATPTFTLKVQGDATGITAQATPFHAYGGRNSRLEIAIVPSN